MSLYSTGIRPAFDQYMLDLAKETRDYGNYWSASAAGYCYRKQLFQRLGVPPVEEDPRKQRVFAVGHIFHEYMQKITKESGLSVASEDTVQDDDLMVRGHFDDIIKVEDRLILYDYKSANSRAFTYKKEDEVGHYHRMQVGTYLYIINKLKKYGLVKEGRLLHISKDDLRQMEQQVLWTPELATEVVTYWNGLNAAWKSFLADRTLPGCTCADHDGGFLAKPQYNDFFYDGEPCSAAWLDKWERSQMETTDNTKEDTLKNLESAYKKLKPEEKKELREKYIKLQDDMCFHCGKSLYKSPPKEITDKPINWDLFPPGFLDYPVHLQHDHNTGMTEGAVHSYCNAVMWQYHGR